MYILANHLHSIFSPNRACHPGSHCWNYYHGAQSFKSSHCNSFEDRVPVDEIYRYPIFKWVAVTRQEWEGTRIVTPAIATRGHALSFLQQRLHQPFITIKSTAWKCKIDIQPSEISFIWTIRFWIIFNSQVVHWQTVIISIGNGLISRESHDTTYSNNHLIRQDSGDKGLIITSKDFVSSHLSYKFSW